MSASIDILALTLLAVIALIAIFLRLRFPGETTESGEEEDLLYQQERYDPGRMTLPLTGLDAGALLVTGAGYLPAGLRRLLSAREDEGDPEATGLAAALHPGAKEVDDKAALRLSWTISAFVILLGLFFLLLWMLTFT